MKMDEKAQGQIAAPAGYKLVPVVLTQKMDEAMDCAMKLGSNQHLWDSAIAVAPVQNEDALYLEATKRFVDRMYPQIALDDAKDAARYRAIRQRYAVKLSRMIDGGGNFSSDKSRQKIDDWADAALKEVAEWDALTAEEKRAYLHAELERLGIEKPKDA